MLNMRVIQGSAKQLVQHCEVFIEVFPAVVWNVKAKFHRQIWSSCIYFVLLPHPVHCVRVLSSRHLARSTAECWWTSGLWRRWNWVRRGTVSSFTMSICFPKTTEISTRVHWCRDTCLSPSTPWLTGLCRGRSYVPLLFLSRGNAPLLCSLYFGGGGRS